MDQSLQTLVIIIVGFLIFMAGFIYYAAFYRLRVRPISTDPVQPPFKMFFKIDCSQRVIIYSARKNAWLARTPVLVPLVVYGVVILTLAPSLDFSQPRDLMFLLFIMVVMGVGFLLGHFRVKPSIQRSRKMFELSKRERLFLSGDAETLRIPALLLMNPTFARAADANVFEIILPMSEIERVEFLPAMGNSPRGFKIHPLGASKKWGQGQLGKADAFQFGIGVNTQLFTTSELTDIISLLRGQLGDRLEIRDPTCLKNR